MVTSYTVVCGDCPYRNICSDNGKKCESCARNPKRSYYEPVVPYVPYIPDTYIPYSPSTYWPYWYPTFTTDAGNLFHYI